MRNVVGALLGIATLLADSTTAVATADGGDPLPTGTGIDVGTLGATALAVLAAVVVIVAQLATRARER